MVPGPEVALAQRSVGRSTRRSPRPPHGSVEGGHRLQRRSCFTRPLNDERSCVQNHCRIVTVGDARAADAGTCVDDGHLDAGAASRLRVVAPHVNVPPRRYMAPAQAAGRRPSSIEALVISASRGLSPNTRTPARVVALKVATVWTAGERRAPSPALTARGLGRHGHSGRCTACWPGRDRRGGGFVIV